MSACMSAGVRWALVADLVTGIVPCRARETPVPLRSSRLSPAFRPAPVPAVCEIPAVRAASVEVLEDEFVAVCPLRAGVVAAWAARRFLAVFGLDASRRRRPASLAPLGPVA